MNLQNKIITILGDSITEGVGVSAPEHIYANVLGRMVGASEVRNFGVSGTRFALQHVEDDPFPEAFTLRFLRMPTDSDLVLVFGGTNDYGHGVAPFGEMTDRENTTFCGACHYLFRGLIERYPTSRIVIVTPLLRADQLGPSPNSGRPLVDYVDTIIAIAAEYSLPVLDLYRTAGISPSIPCHQELYMPDGLHPNDAGAYRIAERMAGFLSTL